MKQDLIARHNSILICLVTWVLSALPAWGVIVFEKGKSEPTRGFLVSENASRVVIRQVLPDGKIEERMIPRSQVEDMIQAVSADRLSGLSRDKPQAYRDYAEELAEKREDPEARATALRLFLIAAYLEPEKLGRSSLLGMVALARSPEEERKLRALAFLLDPDHDRGVLREPAGGTLDLASLSKEERIQLAGLLRALRDGRVDDARSMLKRAGMAGVVQRIAGLVAASDLAGLKNGERIPAPLMRRVISLELWLAGGPGASDDRAGELRRSGWSSLTDPAIAAPMGQLSLTTVTEFNPTACHYRDGKWVAK